MLIFQKKEQYQYSRGFSLVEALLSLAIFSLIITAFIIGISHGSESSRIAGDREVAVALAKEGIEAVRSIRNNTSVDFQTSLPEGSYGLDASRDTWSLVELPDIYGIYSRNINIKEVDENTKKIISEVSWQQNPQREGFVSFFTWLTDWQGLLNNTGGWVSPIQIGLLGLPPNGSGEKVAIHDQHAFVIQPKEDLYSVDVSNLTSLSISGSVLGISGSINDIEIKDDFAYITSTSNSSEVISVKISNPSSPGQSGTLDLPGSDDALSINIKDDHAFVTKSKDRGGFTSFKISSGGMNLDHALDISCSCEDAVILGNYAYVVSNDNSAELQVIDISSPGQMELIAKTDLPGSANPKTITGFGNHVFVGLPNGDLFTVNISNPSCPVVSPTVFDAGGSINDSDVSDDGNLLFLATKNNSMEFQVLSISNPTNPSLISFIDTSKTLNGLNYAEDFVIAVGDAGSEEVIAIIPN